MAKETRGAVELLREYDRDLTVKMRAKIADDVERLDALAESRGDALRIAGECHQQTASAYKAKVERLEGELCEARTLLDRALNADDHDEVWLEMAAFLRDRPLPAAAETSERPTDPGFMPRYSEARVESLCDLLEERAGDELAQVAASTLRDLLARLRSAEESDRESIEMYRRCRDRRDTVNAQLSDLQRLYRGQLANDGSYPEHLFDHN